MKAVYCPPDGTGFKTRASALAYALAGGRFSHRERSYIMSARRAAEFVKLYREGWVGDVIGFSVILPNPPDHNP
jgi:hypothetical protein